MSWPALRGARGAQQVSAALGVCAAPEIVRACLERAACTVAIEVSPNPSRARPGARGRYAAGLITLFPAAFADPLTLAWTLLHELGHAAGLDEAGAEALASSTLGVPCSP